MELQQAFNEDGSMSRNFITELLSTDEITAGGAPDANDEGQLHEKTVAKLQNMLTRDWVLANMTEAQEHDIRYKLEVMKYKIIGTHPHEGAVADGKARAFLFGVDDEELESLSTQQRLLIDEFIEALKGRLTRGRGGFERKQMNTSIAETRSQSEEQEREDGALTGLFR
jgi:predicted transcriptional regulator